MKLLHFHRNLGIFLLLFFSFSCSSDLDFNQANDLKLEPVIVSNLAYFDISAHEFVSSGVEQSLLVDSPTVDVFSDAFFKKHLSRADLFFEVNNTITRAYSLDIIFRDSNNQPLYSVNINVPANTGAENLSTKTEIFQNAKLDLLKMTTKITFAVKMLPGQPLTENSAGTIKLRSGVTAYLIVQ